MVFLDYGCGQGRLTLQYGKQFKLCYAFDPDETRVKELKNIDFKDWPNPPEISNKLDDKLTY